MSGPADPGDPPGLARYSRSDATVADIRDLASLAPTQLPAAFAEATEGSRGYRTAEALVFFILHAIAQDDVRTTEALFKLLRERCRLVMRGWVRGMRNEEDRLEVQSEVIEQMTHRIVRGGADAEFLQSRFWRYLKMRTLTAIGKHKKRYARESLIDDLALGDDEKHDAPVERIHRPQLSPEDRLLIEDALSSLPSELREAYVLRHYAGWRVGDERRENESSHDPTLMEYFGIGRRAMHKRLAKAESLLERYRKDSA